jgi:HSP20 family protein
LSRFLRRRSGIIYHRSERTQGRQWRSLQLPSNVDGSKVSARLDNGVLQIVAPKTSQLDSGRRRVPVIGA